MGDRVEDVCYVRNCDVFDSSESALAAYRLYSGLERAEGRTVGRPIAWMLKPADTALQLNLGERVRLKEADGSLSPDLVVHHWCDPRRIAYLQGTWALTYDTIVVRPVDSGEFRRIVVRGKTRGPGDRPLEPGDLMRVAGEDAS